MFLHNKLSAQIGSGGTPYKICGDKCPTNLIYSVLLVEHLLDFIKEVSAFCVVLVACCAVKLFDKLFLLAVKILRNFNGNSYILVASASAAESLNTLALESEKHHPVVYPHEPCRKPCRQE